MPRIGDSRIEDAGLLPGQRVAPGLYEDMDSGRRVWIECEDFLPASLDGRVACYRRVPTAWGQRPWNRAAQHAGPGRQVHHIITAAVGLPRRVRSR